MMSSKARSVSNTTWRSSPVGAAGERGDSGLGSDTQAPARTASTVSAVAILLMGQGYGGRSRRPSVETPLIEGCSHLRAHRTRYRHVRWPDAESRTSTDTETSTGGRRWSLAPPPCEEDYLAGLALRADPLTRRRVGRLQRSGGSGPGSVDDRPAADVQ